MPSFNAELTQLGQNLTENAGNWCHWCRLQFKAEELEEHKVKAHNVCTRCQRAFSRRPALIRHKETVHGTRKGFGCDVCNHRFKRKDALIRHKRLRHHIETGGMQS
ncbi:hypothetical protein P154DRAFT_539832 [Amniculicola lignicola CBS 123094]|uniref:C2H2-type domain-containing protein n=1 Tax=Amniculicola lignicola CBS 123094 TaxID=1392246 RepID=A0A6A5W4U8_9PLEO|nr:hypothetical protein P154DRAFT_539832 [Amniculicola lignicola CBS 123094]